MTAAEARKALRRGGVVVWASVRVGGIPDDQFRFMRITKNEAGELLRGIPGDRVVWFEDRGFTVVIGQQGF